MNNVACSFGIAVYRIREGHHCCFSETSSRHACPLRAF